MERRHIKRLPLMRGRQMVGIVSRRHREAVGDEIGKPKNKQDPLRQFGADHLGNDLKGRHNLVDSAINPVAEIADPGISREPGANCFPRVTMLKLDLHELPHLPNILQAL